MTPQPKQSEPLMPSQRARELLADAVDSPVFPEKAGWIRAGHQDVLIDGKDALRAIEAALKEAAPATEALADVVRATLVEYSGMSERTARLLTVPLTEANQPFHCPASTTQPAKPDSAREALNVVDRARAIIVRTLDDAARRYDHGHGSHQYLSGMARKVEQAEAATIDSYLVLDCVIAALSTDPTS